MSYRIVASITAPHVPGSHPCDNWISHPFRKSAEIASDRNRSAPRIARDHCTLSLHHNKASHLFTPRLYQLQLVRVEACEETL